MRALAEAPQMLMEFADLKYEYLMSWDYFDDDWEMVKPTIPFQQLPILVVDDDDKIRDLIKQFLVEKNFIVSTAVDSKDAKMQIDTFNFNLIVLDVMMPGQSGYDLTEELKQSKNIPVILLTAKGEVESRIRGLELGADDYLGKPFEPQELLLRINNIIKNN